MSHLPPPLNRLPFPVIGSPLFIISNPQMVIEQCKAGVVGSMPALNARPAAQLDDWLAEITETLAAYDAAHPQAPSVVITSLGAREDVNRAVQGWGGVVLHDVINNVFAHKAIEKGADGLIVVAAGAGGHASVKSPFAMVQEVRQWFDGPLALSGSIASGGAILAAQAMGADFAYIGVAVEGYKKMITESDSDDIVYSNFYTGIHGNYLKGSIRNAGMDPDNLPVSDPSKMNFSTGEGGKTAKAWKDIWGCGQGIGAITEVVSTADMVARFKREYREARERLLAMPY